MKKSRNSRKVQNFNFLRLRRPERICSGLAPGKRCLRGVESAKSAKSCVFRVLYPPGTPRLPRRTPPATSARRRRGCTAPQSAPGYLGAEAAALRAGLPLATSVRRPLRCARVCPWLPRCGGRCAARASAPGYLGAEAGALRGYLGAKGGEVVVSHPSPRPPWSTRAIQLFVPQRLYLPEMVW